MAVFKHDCDHCEYLGSFVYDAVGLGVTIVDLYCCPSSYGGTFIARHGDDGPEYSSCPKDILETNLEKYKNGPHSSYSPGIYEAYKRKQENSDA